MTYWAIIVLVVAALGVIYNVLEGTPMERVLHDVVIFLIGLGMLIRVRFKTKQAEKRDKEKESTD
ncbi:unnamed protein product [marine sediment metagenome]|uniref:Uncharacterized protein n=1 Tax=marine sediment metagenome TaxID=412755 RepID=X0VDB8_9ZZZZ